MEAIRWRLIFLSPTGGTAGRKNLDLYKNLGNWNRQTKLGEAFDSSTIFVLPNMREKVLMSVGLVR